MAGLREVIKRGFIPDCIMLAGRYTLLDQSALGEFFELCEKHKFPLLLQEFIIQEF